MISARILVGTRITKWDVLGTMIMIIGGTLVAVFGDGEKAKLDIDDLMKLYKRVAFIVYFSLLDVVCLCLFLASNHFTRTLDDELKTFTLARDINNLDAGHGDDAEEDETDRIIYLRKLIGIGFAATGATLASQSVLLAESVVRLIQTSFEKQNQFTSIEPFILLLGLGFTAVSQVYCTNAAVTRCETVIMAPVFFAVFSILTLMNGNVYYDQWHMYSPLAYTMIILGILILLVGICIISAGARNREKHLEAGFSAFFSVDKEVAIEDIEPLLGGDDGDTVGDSLLEEAISSGPLQHRKKQTLGEDTASSSFRSAAATPDRQDLIVAVTPETATLHEPSP